MSGVGGILLRNGVGAIANGIIDGDIKLNLNNISKSKINYTNIGLGFAIDSGFEYGVGKLLSPIKKMKLDKFGAKYTKTKHFLELGNKYVNRADVLRYIDKTNRLWDVLGKMSETAANVAYSYYSNRR